MFLAALIVLMAGVVAALSIVVSPRVAVADDGHGGFASGSTSGSGSNSGSGGGSNPGSSGRSGGDDPLGRDPDHRGDVRQQDPRAAPTPTARATTPSRRAPSATAAPRSRPAARPATGTGTGTSPGGPAAARTPRHEAAPSSTSSGVLGTRTVGSVAAGSAAAGPRATGSSAPDTAARAAKPAPAPPLPPIQQPGTAGRPSDGAATPAVAAIPVAVAAESVRAALWVAPLFALTVSVALLGCLLFLGGRQLSEIRQVRP
jgi:hypothetical protein